MLDIVVELPEFMSLFVPVPLACPDNSGIVLSFTRILQQKEFSEILPDLSFTLQ